MDNNQQSLINIEEKKPKRRFFELDFLRGMCVILMMVDHFFFSAYEVLPMIQEYFGKDFFIKLPVYADLYWHSMGRNTARYVVVFMFMFLCGVSCTFSKSNFKRGVKALIVAGGITVATGIASWFMGGYLTIYFGVIHMLAFCMLIYWAVSIPSQMIKKINKGKKSNKAFDIIGRLMPMTIGLVLLIIYFAVPLGKLETIKRVVMVDGERVENYIPELYYVIKAGGSQSFQYFLSALIDIEEGGLARISADYFPLMPYCAIVLLGSGFGELVYKNENAKNYPHIFATIRKEPVSLIGRNAIFAYVVHQVLILIFFAVAGLIA